jgi:hypothetical protein
MNLLVGRNSVGKSRTLNILSALAKHLSGETKEIVFSGTYRATFSNDRDGAPNSPKESWVYNLDYDNAEISQEDLYYNDKNVLHRGRGGMGQIDAVDIQGEDVRIKFRVPPKQIAVAAKRDAVQHPYLEKLFEWGDNLRHFQFGYEMRSHNLAFAVKGFQGKIDEKDTSSLVPIFDLAVRTFGDEFKQVVMDDMAALGYPLLDLKISKPQYTKIEGFLPGDLVGVSAQERDLPGLTDQPHMSQGMFRTLSLLIQTTYYQKANKAGCILIDDIGEGLDFERSCILIDLLRDKAKRSSFQLIMSTNNRFVMNNVPLEEWCVLQRDRNRVRIRNYANSASVFEDFKLTGLNNFDLLKSNFFEGK